MNRRNLLKHLSLAPLGLALPKPRIESPPPPRVEKMEKVGKWLIQATLITSTGTSSLLRMGSHDRNIGKDKKGGAITTYYIDEEFPSKEVAEKYLEKVLIIDPNPKTTYTVIFLEDPPTKQLPNQNVYVY